MPSGSFGHVPDQTQSVIVESEAKHARQLIPSTPYTYQDYVKHCDDSRQDPRSEKDFCDSIIQWQLKEARRTAEDAGKAFVDLHEFENSLIREINILHSTIEHQTILTATYVESEEELARLEQEQEMILLELAKVETDLNWFIDT